MRTNGQYLSGIPSASVDGRPIVPFIEHKDSAQIGTPRNLISPTDISNRILTVRPSAHHIPVIYLDIITVLPSTHRVLDVYLTSGHHSYVHS